MTARDIDQLTNAIRDGLTTENLMGDVFSIPQALMRIAESLNRLGNADAATPMGALEAHGRSLVEAAEIIRSGLSDVADAIRESNANA